MNQTHYAICTLTMLFEVVVLYLIAVFAASENASHWILWFKDTLHKMVQHLYAYKYETFALVEVIIMLPR